MISLGSVGTTVSRIKVKNNCVSPLLERGRWLIFLKLQMLFLMFLRKQDQNITASLVKNNKKVCFSALNLSILSILKEQL